LISMLCLHFQNHFHSWTLPYLLIAYKFMLCMYIIHPTTKQKLRERKIRCNTHSWCMTLRSVVENAWHRTMLRFNARAWQPWVYPHQLYLIHSLHLHIMFRDHFTKTSIIKCWGKFGMSLKQDVWNLGHFPFLK
jgi:hypothetical protein